MPIHFKPLQALAAVTLTGALGLLGAPAHAWDWSPTSRIAGSGQITTTQRQVTGFKGIALDVPARVVIVQGDSEGVLIETDDNITPLIETVVENDQLKIRLAQRFTSIRPKSLKITVNARQIESLSISGSGDIQSSQIKSTSLSTRISGSGNVAQYTIEKLLQRGARPVTLSDSEGAIHDPDGLNAEKLAWVLELKNHRRGRIKEYAPRFGARYFPGQRPWDIPCDCAFPCATENEISGADARTLLNHGCTLVSEGANMPSAPEAIDLFQQAGILYGPGKAANAGGVATSGLEMTQNAMRLAWSREEVDQRLHRIMVDSHHLGRQTAEDYGHPGNYVMGANIAGFVKVADAMLAQGLV